MRADGLVGKALDLHLRSGFKLLPSPKVRFNNVGKEAIQFAFMEALLHFSQCFLFSPHVAVGNSCH